MLHTKAKASEDNEQERSLFITLGIFLSRSIFFYMHYIFLKNNFMKFFGKLLRLDIYLTVFTSYILLFNKLTSTT